MAKCLFQSGGGGGKSKLKPVTATANDVLKGKVIVDANGNPLTGTIESMSAQTITPSSSNKTVACNGKYMTGDISVKGDANLVAGNILSGKTIFGVAGNAQKFAHQIVEGSSAGDNRLTYNTPSGTARARHFDATFGFIPRIYGHRENGNRDSGDGGVLCSGGIYRCFVVKNCTVNVNSTLINGRTIHYPVSYMDTNYMGLAAGYY